MNIIFLKLSLRKLFKTKVYSIANLLGLTIGFAAFILIALFIRYELNWDKSHENYNRIYRVQRNMTNALHTSSGNNISPHTSAITAQLIEEQYPEFEELSVIRDCGSTYLGTDDEHLVHEEDGINADTCFFNVFSYQFIEGDKNTALNQPYAVVLSETLARKLFEKTDVLGKTIFLEKKHPLTVSGVYKDLPFNSSLRPSFIISFSTLKPLRNIDQSSLWVGDCMTFALLQPEISAQRAEDKIKHLFTDYESMKHDELQLCSLSKVYLNFNDSSDYLVILKLFGLIGIFILVMSGFNYINLSLAQASMRGKEVAVKKVIGSRKQSLVLQFLSETTTVSLIALLMALLLAKLFLPIFNNVVDKQIAFNLLNDWTFMLLMFVVALGTGLLSGIYPAWFMASSKIVILFKGNIFNKQQNSFSLKKALITFQFAISLFLIVLTASFSMQIKHITEKDLGFKEEGLLYTEINVSDNKTIFYQLRDRLKKHPGLKDVSMSKHFPFVSQGGGTTNWEGGNSNDKVVCRFNHVSSNYLSLLNAKLIAGRNFLPGAGNIGKSCIINETAAKCFGWDDPIGKRLSDNQLTVVGVVKDFIYHDMHNPVEPGIYILAPNTIEGNWTFAFRSNNSKNTALRAVLDAELQKTFPKDPFEIHDFPSAFKSENAFMIYQSVNNTLLFFSLLNVLLAIVGMFGLVSFAVARRTKEIGIRKINGSSPAGIFHLLNREYYVLLLLAILMAFPGALIVYNLLPSANKLPAQPWVFISAAILLFLIVQVSTSYATIKAAARNPIKALRYE